MGWLFWGPPDIDKLEAKKNVRALIAALHHKDVSSRYSAMLALGRCGDDRAVAPLTAYYESDRRSPPLRTLAALGATASRSNDEAVVAGVANYLLQKLSRALDFEPIEAGAAVDGLHLVAVRTANLILDACDISNINFRAARHMLRRMPADAAPALVAALDHPQRAPYAAEALGVLKFEPAADRLYELARSGQIADQAALALAEMCDPRSIALIEERLCGPRAASLLSRGADMTNALARCGAGAIPALKNILASSDSSDARSAAHAALGRAGWKPETIDERIAAALSIRDRDALRACHAENPRAVAAAILGAPWVSLELIETFGDARAIAFVVQSWTDCADSFSQPRGSEHVAEFQIAAVLERLMTRAAGEASEDDLRRVASLPDRDVQWYPTRDGEPHLGYAPSTKTVSVDAARKIARAELHRRGAAVT